MANALAEQDKVEEALESYSKAIEYARAKNDVFSNMLYMHSAFQFASPQRECELARNWRRYGCAARSEQPLVSGHQQAVAHSLENHEMEEHYASASFPPSWVAMSWQYSYSPFWISSTIDGCI